MQPLARHIGVKFEANRTMSESSFDAIFDWLHQIVMDAQIAGSELMILEEAIPIRIVFCLIWRSSSHDATHTFGLSTVRIRIDLYFAARAISQGSSTNLTPEEFCQHTV
jgi:hypothetical protein